jgi:hypothetical protein
LEKNLESERQKRRLMELDLRVERAKRRLIELKLEAEQERRRIIEETLLSFIHKMLGRAPQQFSYLSQTQLVLVLNFFYIQSLKYKYIVLFSFPLNHS